MVSGVRMFHFCLYHQGELCRLLSLLKSSETLSEEQLAGLCILMSDFQGSLASVQPSAKREGFATVPDVTWEDVGALHDIREELTMAILVGIVLSDMLGSVLATAKQHKYLDLYYNLGQEFLLFRSRGQENNN